MSWYCNVELELAHIRRAIELLERTQHAFANKSSVNDPAYWRAKLTKLRAQFERNRVLELQMNELLIRLERIRNSSFRS
ncbi:hypothetical protein C6V06_25230 [Burkholderia gladioli]|nr:hypothetical protein C6V06_25230 [Burkholderia gladioli]PRH08010.1 hypothetical protein C6V08_07995 [Burkholderia gladioli]